VVHERFQRWRKMGVFEKLMKRMAEYYAREQGGIGWKWQAMDSKHCPAPLGGQKVSNNPTATDGGADDLVAGQAPESAHSLVEEG
jgi:hypothetical protein